MTVKELREKLSNYSDEDHIILNGHPDACGIYCDCVSLSSIKVRYIENSWAGNMITDKKGEKAVLIQ